MSDPRLTPLLIAIHEDPGADWSVAITATKAGLSRAALAALFRELVGRTPNDYLTGWRITVAKERPRAGESVARTANAPGYTSAAAFSRTFSQRTGLSPRQWLLDAGR